MTCRLQVYPFAHISTATNNWNRETNGLGRGGSGEVFHANLDGVDVAVKLIPRGDSNDAQFVTELTTLSNIQHEYLIPLLGISVGTDRVCLIYPRAARGDVVSNLSSLNWSQRIRIAFEAATALSYLHSQDPVVLHRDFKSRNVLLDEEFKVKVCDFGVARLLQDGVTHVQTRLIGTPGYVDPEYLTTYQVSRYCDVYSYGVFLMELITGLPAFSQSRQPPVLVGLFQRTMDSGDSLASLKDGNESCGEITDAVITELCEIARMCALVAGPDRLSMDAVVERLGCLVTRVGGEAPAAPRTCVVCLDSPREVVLPCNHAVLCMQCALRMIEASDLASLCPTCRAPFGEYRAIDADAGEAVETFIGVLDGTAAQDVFDRAEDLLFGRNGTVQNAQEASRLYFSCVQRGHLRAMVAVALLYRDGFGFGRINKDEWERWIRRAADGGDQLGEAYCLKYGIGVERNYDRAFALGRAEADAGDVRARSFVGDCYYYGEGIDQNYTQAVHWYLQAADQGHAVAQCNLGHCYYDGDGVIRDHTQAVHWYQLAADRNCVQAQRYLGRCYARGDGVVQDYEQSVRFVKLAADQGDADARKLLKRLEEIVL